MLGHIELGTGQAVLNPPDKAANNLSRVNVEAFVTIAWGGWGPLEEGEDDDAEGSF